MKTHAKMFTRLVTASVFALSLVTLIPLQAHSQSWGTILSESIRTASYKPAQNAAINCESHFYQGKVPSVSRFVKNTRMLCFDDYAVMHSGVTKTPIFTGELLTKDSIRRGAAVKRTDDFHAESRLKPLDRAELNDYKHSGYDRGHMAADKDAPWSDDLDSLANMVPQAPILNREDWADLEHDVRRLAKLRGSVFVMTGPAFEGEEKFIGRGVRVPSHVWKIGIDPTRGDTQAYVAKNINGARVEVTTVPAIERLTGIHFSH